MINTQAIKDGQELAAKFDASLDAARKRAQRMADGSDKPAYIVRNAAGALLAVMFAQPGVEVVETVQPS